MTTTAVKSDQCVDIVCVFNEYSLIIREPLDVNPQDVVGCYITPKAVMLETNDRKIRISLANVKHMINNELVDDPKLKTTQNHLLFYERIIAAYYLFGNIAFNYESYMFI